MALLGVSEAGLVRVEGLEYPGNELSVFTADEYENIQIAHNDPDEEDPVEILPGTVYSDIINEETEAVFGTPAELKAFIDAHFIAPPPAPPDPEVLNSLLWTDSETGVIQTMEIADGVVTITPGPAPEA